MQEYTLPIFVIQIMFKEITDKPSNSGIKRKLYTHTIETKLHAISNVERGTSEA